MDKPREIKTTIQTIAAPNSTAIKNQMHDTDPREVVGDQGNFWDYKNK